MGLCHMNGLVVVCLLLSDVMFNKFTTSTEIESRYSTSIGGFIVCGWNNSTSLSGLQLPLVLDSLRDSNPVLLSRILNFRLVLIHINRFVRRLLVTLLRNLSACRITRSSSPFIHLNVIKLYRPIVGLSAILPLLILNLDEWFISPLLRSRPISSISYVHISFGISWLS